MLGYFARRDKRNPLHSPDNATSMPRERFWIYIRNNEILYNLGSIGGSWFSGDIPKYSGWFHRLKFLILKGEDSNQIFPGRSVLLSASSCYNTGRTTPFARCKNFMKTGHEQFARLNILKHLHNHFGCQLSINTGSFLGAGLLKRDSRASFSKRVLGHSQVIILRLQSLDKEEKEERKWKKMF